MKKYVILGMLAATAGCSSPYATNGENLYQLSRNGPGVVVPPPLTTSNISHFYDLPLQTENPAVSIAPPRVV